jgi:single-strand DNA-binding protein
MNGNTITVVGNLTKDPTVKYLPTGKAVTNFSLACNHGRYDKATQTWVDGEASFFKVECWEAMAENVAESLRKGDPLIVVGRLERRTYEQDGQTRESWEIKADAVGPDLRRRAASVRRVLRQNQPTDGPETAEGRPLEGPVDGLSAATDDDAEAPRPATNLAVAS